jgi:hypothetical protein
VGDVAFLHCTVTLAQDTVSAPSTLPLFATDLGLMLARRRQQPITVRGRWVGPNDAQYLRALSER